MPCFFGGKKSYSLFTWNSNLIQIWLGVFLFAKPSNWNLMRSSATHCPLPVSSWHARLVQNLRYQWVVKPNRVICPHLVVDPVNVCNFNAPLSHLRNTYRMSATESKKRKKEKTRALVSWSLLCSRRGYTEANCSKLSPRQPPGRMCRFKRVAKMISLHV